jgi:hypothetical protein
MATLLDWDLQKPKWNYHFSDGIVFCICALFLGKRVKQRRRVSTCAYLTVRRHTDNLALCLYASRNQVLPEGSRLCENHAQGVFYRGDDF